MVHRGGVPTFDRRVQKIDVGVEIDRNDGRGVEDERLGFGEDGGASGRVGDGIRAIRKGVVSGISPAGVVVAGIAPPHVEKGGGIEIVGGPATEENLIVAGATAGEDDFVFLVHEADIEAEIAAPHLLNRFGHEAKNLGVVVKDLDGRESGAAGMTRGNEQLASSREIVRAARRRRVALEQRRDESRRGLSTTGQNVAGDVLAVDGQREGAPDANIVERRAADVEAEEISFQIGVDAKSRRFLALQRANFGER